MKQAITKAIILSRTDYGEADRILTLLTPDYGKLVLIAKGVRRIKSKLAGGIELFSVSELVFIKGRSEVGTLVSSRLITHYDKIVGDIERTMTGYDLTKQLNKLIEDQADEAYFTLLKDTFEALNNSSISLELVKLWFMMQLLRLEGHTPNLQTDVAGMKLQPNKQYRFDYDHMAFSEQLDQTFGGLFNAKLIKFLRLGFGDVSAELLNQVEGSQQLALQVIPLIMTISRTYLR